MDETRNTIELTKKSLSLLKRARYYLHNRHHSIVLDSAYTYTHTHNGRCWPFWSFCSHSIIHSLRFCFIFSYSFIFSHILWLLSLSLSLMFSWFLDLHQITNNNHGIADIKQAPVYTVPYLIQTYIYILPNKARNIHFVGKSQPHTKHNEIT